LVGGKQHITAARITPAAIQTKYALQALFKYLTLTLVSPPGQQNDFGTGAGEFPVAAAESN